MEDGTLRVTGGRVEREEYGEYVGIDWISMIREGINIYSTCSCPGRIDLED